jgi:glucose-6-phosphate 1-dehydrogenase
VGKRGGYFDDYGIIRDVVQNHLTQILALIAMERPTGNYAKSVRDEKIRVLKSIKPLRVDDIVLGQYSAGNSQKSYRDEESIPSDSITPTYAASVLHVDNSRWSGVPFYVTAGKGLETSVSEVRICFKEVPQNIFCKEPKCLPANELIIRIQPDEAILLRVLNKVPGLGHDVGVTELDLRYAQAFAQKEIPDAYECLLLDVMVGDRSLFIGSDELAAAWDIFTPVLHEIDRRSIEPEPYAFGSSGPARKDVNTSAGRE